MRFLVLLVVLVVGGCGAAESADGGFRWSSLSSLSRTLGPTAGPSRDPLVVLHEWDARRATAWAAGDPAAVRALYVDGSTAGNRDAALVQDYRDRGFTVTGMRMQVLRARVLVRRPDLLRIDVVDRLAAAVAVRSDGERISLPRDAPARRTVELRWVGGTWRMARVLAQP